MDNDKNTALDLSELSHDLEKLEQALSKEENEAKNLKYTLEHIEGEGEKIDEKLPEVKKKLDEKYSAVSNFVFLLISIAITGSIVLFFYDNWVKSSHSVFWGLLFFAALAMALLWNLGAVLGNSKKEYVKKQEAAQKEYDELMAEKEDIVKRKEDVLNQINANAEMINTLKGLKEKAIAFKENATQQQLQELYEAAIEGERFNRAKLKEAADMGHLVARLEFAKLLLDDYCSSEYTFEEKFEIINKSTQYVKHLSNTDDPELEFLYLFCHTSSVWLSDDEKTKAALKRIREIKNEGVLSPKYEQMATNLITTLVKIFNDKSSDSKKETSEYSPATSTIACRFYTNGICALKSSTTMIPCHYADGLWKLCLDYKRK